IPDQAGPHVPAEIPPVITLPDAAIEHMPENALSNLPEHLSSAAQVIESTAPGQDVSAVPDWLTCDPTAPTPAAAEAADVIMGVPDWLASGSATPTTAAAGSSEITAG